MGASSRRRADSATTMAQYRLPDIGGLSQAAAARNARRAHARSRRPHHDSAYSPSQTLLRKIPPNASRTTTKTTPMIRTWPSTGPPSPAPSDPGNTKDTSKTGAAIRRIVTKSIFSLRMIRGGLVKRLPDPRLRAAKSVVSR